MASPLVLQLSDYLRHTCPNLRLGGLIASVSRNGSQDAGITAALEAVSRELLAQDDPLRHPRLLAMEETFRRAGANPKRYAPSAHALIRRLVQGRDLVRINDLVDTNSLLSLTLRVPCGIYDRTNIAGSRLTFDLGAGQATYLGIDGVEQRTQGKLLLTDRDKVLGGPHADAWPTRITDETRHLLVVLYLPDRPESPMEIDDLMGQARGLFERMVQAAVLGEVVGG